MPRKPLDLSQLKTVRTNRHFPPAPVVDPGLTAALKKAVNTVNHPPHYGGRDNPYETIKVMESRLTKEEFIGAMKFNVYKYNDRAKQKGSELENYEKAQFYQNYLVDFMRRVQDVHKA